MRPANLKWGYPARGNSFFRRVRTVLIATAVGASFGCIVVLSFFAPSIEKGTLTQQEQPGQAPSTPTLQLNRKPVDIDSAKAAEVSGHSDGAAATVSTRTSTLAPLGRSTFAEQRTATDHRPGEPVAVASETAAQLVETNATERHHIASSDTRSGHRRFAIGKSTCALELLPLRAMRTVTGSGLIRMPTGVMAAGTDVSVFASGEAAALKFHANVVNCAMEV
jgi:hypothetical protein